MATKPGSDSEVKADKRKDMDVENEGQSVEKTSNTKSKAFDPTLPIKTPLSGMEAQFLGKFMSPMFSKMEEAVSKNTRMLDMIQQDLDDEKEVRRKENSSKHIPDAIKQHGQDLTEIMQHLEKLVLYESYEQTEDDTNHVKARLKTLDENAEVMVLSHSIAAYVSTLEPQHLKHLANKMVSDTTLWLSRLFRLDNSSAYFHDDEREGLVRTCRLVLHNKYPDYARDGFMALQDSPPVIYVSAAARPGLGMHLCTQLGLPVTSIETVPLYLNTHKMDILALEELILEHVEAGRRPLMVVAYAGTPVIGHVDDLTRIQGICQNNDIWLHIEGNSVALLTWFTVPTNIRPLTSGDSLAINLGGWLGLPAVPYVTLYRTPEDIAHARAAGLTYYNAKHKLSCMPVWVCLQNIGHYGIVKKIEYSVNLANKVHTKINQLENVRNVTLCEIENPSVVFRYVKADDNPDVNEQEEEQDEKQKNDRKTKVEDSETNEDSAGDIERVERNPYFDALNIWLCETLKRDCAKVHIAAIDIIHEGVCIRFAPMESIHDYDTTEDEVEYFLHSLDTQLSILDATVRQREVFQRVVADQHKLRVISLPNWAGLGAVQYIPESQIGALENLTEAAQAEMNKINYELVHQLKSADTAFSLGHSQGQLFCVRFGLVTDDTDLEELIGLVYSTGKQVEESSKFLDTMAEVIRQGITQAEQDLVKENQDKVQQEGALRQLPVVGSLLNWWSPPPKDPIKGRTFNLQSGTVVSTEETYKYHMQVQQVPSLQLQESQDCTSVVPPEESIPNGPVAAQAPGPVAAQAPVPVAEQTLVPETQQQPQGTEDLK